MSSLSLKNVTVAHRLKNLSFDFQHSERIAVIGPNGAGKSSLIEVLSGKLAPDVGEVLHLGSLIKSAEEQAKIRAVLTQSQDIPSGFFVDELILESAHLSTHQEALSYLKQLSDALDLTHLLKRKAHTLSGGEAQRMMLAKAAIQLLSTPNQAMQFLILDEPCASQDIRHLTLLKAALTNWLKNHHWGILFSVHDINFAAHNADKILALKNGEVVAYDSAANVMNSQTLSAIFDCKFTAYRNDQNQVMWHSF